MNGCWNRPPFLEVMKLKNGLQIPFTMAKTCQYTLTELGKNDEGCAGCKHKVREESIPSK